MASGEDGPEKSETQNWASGGKAGLAKRQGLTPKPPNRAIALAFQGGS